MLFRVKVIPLRRSLQFLNNHRGHHHRHTTPPLSHLLNNLQQPTSKTFIPVIPFNQNRFLSTLSSSSDAELRKYLDYAALVLFSAAATYYSFPFSENAKHKKAQIFRYVPLPEDLHTVSNWSGTHEVHTRVFHQPESLEQLELLVKDAHEKRTRILPVGSGLSPNGIGLSRAGMINLALLDKVLEVDEKKKTVRVQAGIRVQQLVDAIKDYGLTLQNFASIREQ